MASRKDIEAGAAYIRLYVKNSQLLSGLQSMSRQIADFATKATTALAGVGTIGVGAALAATKAFANSGDELNKMADRTGASVEALSELRHAVNQSGSSLEQLELAMRTMAMKGGTGDPVANLERLADQLAAIPDPGQRAKAAIDAMGEAGTRLLPLFANGSKGIRDLRQEARDLGLTFTKDMADNATAFGDAWGRLSSSAGALGNQIGGTLAPAMTQIAGILTQGAKSLSEWTTANQSAIAAVATMGAELLNPSQWARSGKLVVTSAATAIVDTWSAVAGVLSDAAGSVVGDTLGTIASEIVDGDLQGAWDTVTLGLAATWDSFVASVANAAAELAQAVTEIWRKMTTAISDFIIENQRMLKQLLDVAAQVTGGKLFEAVSGVNIADSILGPDIAPGDVAAAKDTARQSIGNTAAGLSAAIEQRRQSLADTAAMTSQAFSDRTAGGQDRLRSDLQSIVDDVLSDAQSRRREATRLTEVPAIEGPAAVMRAGGTMGTFSAAAASALGGSSGVQERIARVNEQQKRQLDKMVGIETQLLAAVQHISGGLRFS